MKHPDIATDYADRKRSHNSAFISEHQNAVDKLKKLLESLRKCYTKVLTKKLSRIWSTLDELVRLGVLTSVLIRKHSDDKVVRKWGITKDLAGWTRIVCMVNIRLNHKQMEI